MNHGALKARSPDRFPRPPPPAPSFHLTLPYHVVLIDHLSIMLLRHAKSYGGWGQERGDVTFYSFLFIFLLFFYFHFFYLNHDCEKEDIKKH